MKKILGRVILLGGIALMIFSLYYKSPSDSDQIGWDRQQHEGIDVVFRQPFPEGGDGEQKEAGRKKEMPYYSEGLDLSFFIWGISFIAVGSGILVFKRKK